MSELHWEHPETLRLVQKHCDAITIASILSVRSTTMSTDKRREHARYPTWGAMIGQSCLCNLQCVETFRWTPPVQMRREEKVPPRLTELLSCHQTNVIVAADLPDISRKTYPSHLHDMY